MEMNNVFNQNTDIKRVEESSYYWKKEPVIFNPIKNIEQNKPTIIELFSGLGGLSIGFEMAGFSTFLGSDIFIPSIETFRHSHLNSFSILSDVRKIKPKLLHEIINNRKIHVLAAGIPCQGFSLNNRKRWINDERNFLFREYIRIFHEIKPKFALIENVSGLKSTDNGSFKDAIIEALSENTNYKVSFLTFNAVNFGVPQFRERIFFLAFNKDMDIDWQEEINKKTISKIVTVKDAIYDLPMLNSGEKADKYSQNPISEYQKFMRNNQEILYNHKAPNHPQNTIEKIKNTEPGKPMYEKFTQRIRLSWDLPSPTQVSGGIRPQFQFGHPDQNRGLTVRERCRIQSIPDFVKIFGGVVQERVQTGNAVPPLLAKAIAEVIINAI